MRIAKEAWPFVVPFLIGSIAVAIFANLVWGAVVAALGLAVLLFFRDPQRSFDGDPAWVTAPADGVVTRVDTVEDPAVGTGRFHRIVTFLSAFDVHVQRVPVSGEVVSSGLRPGRKVAAFREDAGEVNASHLSVIRRRAAAAGDPVDGDLVGVRQIAGLMARRVVCYLQTGQSVVRGQHLGIIKFGSRVDLLVPDGYRLLVKKGDRLKNGETVVAKPGDR